MDETRTAASQPTKTVNGVVYRVQTDKVTLHGKVHHASPNRWVRNGANERVSHPLCGQRSRRFYPSYLVSNDEHPVTCEKCRAIAEA